MFGSTEVTQRVARTVVPVRKDVLEPGVGLLLLMGSISAKAGSV